MPLLSREMCSRVAAAAENLQGNSREIGALFFSLAASHPPRAAAIPDGRRRAVSLFQAGAMSLDSAASAGPIRARVVTDIRGPRGQASVYHGKVQSAVLLQETVRGRPSAHSIDGYKQMPSLGRSSRLYLSRWRLLGLGPSHRVTRRELITLIGGAAAASSLLGAAAIPSQSGSAARVARRSRCDT